MSLERDASRARHPRRSAGSVGTLQDHDGPNPAPLGDVGSVTPDQRAATTGLKPTRTFGLDPGLAQSRHGGAMTERFDGRATAGSAVG